MLKAIIPIVALMGLAQLGHATMINGTVDFIAGFSTNSEITFTAVAPSASQIINQGTAVGPVTYTTLTATSTNYTNTIEAAGQMNISVGPGGSVDKALAEAFSGTVRVTNSGSAEGSFNLQQSLLYSLTTTGPGQEGISVFATIERLNPSTLNWDIVGATGFGLGSDESRTVCATPCLGTTGYFVAGNSTADFRLHTILQGSLSQPPIAGGQVPEPATIGYAAVGITLLIVGRYKRN